MIQKVSLFVVTVIAIVVTCLWLSARKAISEATDISKTKPDTAHYWHDQYGKLHATLEETTLSSAAAKLLYAKQLDSLGKLYKTAAGNISRITTEGTTTKIDKDFQVTDTLYFPVSEKSADTSKRIRRLTGTFDDWWLHSVVTLGDINHQQTEVRDTTSTVFYQKGFFTKKNYMDINHSAPYVKTNMIKSQYIKDANGSWQVVIFAGAGYDATSMAIKKPVPVFGIGIAKRIFSIGK